MEFIYLVLWHIIFYNINTVYIFYNIDYIFYIYNI